MVHLQKNNDEIRVKYQELSSNLSMFLKRHLYSEQKKQEIDTRTANLESLKQRLAKVKSSVELFEQISRAVDSGQFSIAIKLLKKLDDDKEGKDLGVNIPSMGTVFSKLRANIV